MRNSVSMQVLAGREKIASDRRLVFEKVVQVAADAGALR